MGDAHMNSNDNDFGSDDDDFVPGLCDESDESDDEPAAAVVAASCTQDSASETEEEDLSRYDKGDADDRVLQKRNNNHLDSSANVRKRARKARSTTHATKLECVDTRN